MAGAARGGGRGQGEAGPAWPRRAWNMLRGGVAEIRLLRTHPQALQSSQEPRWGASIGVRGGPRCPLHGWADGRHWRVLTGLGVCLPPSVARTSQSPLFPRDLILTNRTCDDPRSECGRILRCRG